MKIALGATLTATLLLAGAARAAGPATFTYSGFLTDAGGAPVTSASTLTFRLYASASGGAPLFTSEAVGVAPGTDGFFSAVVGAGAALPATIFDAPAFLSVQYGGEAEMSPRVALTSVPSAFSARAVDWAAVENRPESSCSGSTPFVVGVGADGLAKCAAAPGGAAGCSSGQVLAWSGSAWACSPALELGDGGGLYGTDPTAARSDHAHAVTVHVGGDAFRPFYGSPTAGTVTLGAAVLPGYQLSGTAGVGFAVTVPAVPATPTVRWTLYNPGASSLSLSLRVAATGIAAGAAPPTTAWGGAGYPAPTIGAGQTATISVTIGSNYTDVCRTPRVPIAAGDLVWIGLDGMAANPTYWVLAADVTF